MNASLCDRTPMRNSNAVESNSPLSSVPISLYRELCGELRHKTQELEAADDQNQRLIAQNQQLRQELHQLVQRVIQTQQAVTQMTTELPSKAVAASVNISPNTLATTPLPARRHAMRSVHDQSISPRVVPSAIASAPDHDKIEPLTTRLLNQTHTFTQDLQGWKMAVVMGLIVLSAFGAGFLIMRPFMAKQNLQSQPLQPQLQTPKR